MHKLWALLFMHKLNYGSRKFASLDSLRDWRWRFKQKSGPLLTSTKASKATTSEMEIEVVVGRDSVDSSGGERRECNLYEGRWEKDNEGSIL